MTVCLLMAKEAAEVLVALGEGTGSGAWAVVVPARLLEQHGVDTVRGACFARPTLDSRERASAQARPP